MTSTRRRTVLATVTAAVLLAAGILWGTHSSGQQGQAPVNGKPAEGPLPIKQVVLFNSGVGYFQREGEVDGNARVELTFPVGDINDLLKSLVLQDLGGGKVSTVSYDSQDPIDKTLRSFALDLTGNPTFGQILNQARGEKIEITLRDKAPPFSKVTGTIVGMESHRKQVKDQVFEAELLNITSAGKGLQSIRMEEVLGVRFLNQTLDREFQRALQVLAASHDVQKKTVSLGFNGAGKRSVKVGYVVDRPIWKTTYRLRMEKDRKVYMQGWALVENPSDDDWNNVRMVLVSGRPISFKMNLYEPLYIPRPTVDPDLYASLRPPVYGGSINPSDAKAGQEPVQQKGGDVVAAPKKLPGGETPQQMLMNPNFGNMGGFSYNPYMPMNSFMGGGLNNMGGFGAMNMGGFGQGGGQFGQFGNRYQNNEAFNFDNSRYLQNNKLSYEELQQRRLQQREVKEDAKKRGAAIAGLNFKEGIASVASAEEVGDYYRYVLDQQISLARQKSAMLPILDQTIEGHKVSIYNESVQAKYPLLGLRLKNTAGQPLTQGPITVYEDGSYAGDTRILDLQPNEERLLSYALDQGTEVKTEVKSSPSPDMNFKIGGNSLAARYKLRETRTYIAKNRSGIERTLIVEHPIRPQWKLINPMKPAEKTRDIYRFEVKIAAGQTAKLEVVEEQARVDQVVLTNPKDAKPFYAVGLGIEVKQVVQTDEPKLTELKIVKGNLYPRMKVRETTAYYVQNLSDQERKFVVDHVVRPEWALLGQDGIAKRGPDVFRFTLEAKAGKTADRQVVEEKILASKAQSVKDTRELTLQEYLASPIASGDVKAALNRYIDLSGKLRDNQHKLKEADKQLTALSTDQSRLRENLKIIPQTSEPYKKFLEKIVTQETEIDTLQRQIRQLQGSVQSQEKEVAKLLASMNAA
ncbi:MAG: DUF4139 domain-containing protein [Planctomycetes bacterium]|nr:DUF4139 domain-containing protein [Planctomycetota bacterium]